MTQSMIRKRMSDSDENYNVATSEEQEAMSLAGRQDEVAGNILLRICAAGVGGVNHSAGTELQLHPCGPSQLRLLRVRGAFIQKAAFQ